MGASPTPPDPHPDGLPEKPHPAQSAAPSRPGRGRRWSLAAVVVAALAAWVIWVRGAPMQKLDRATIEQAMQTWQSAEIRDYDLVVELVGRMAGEFQLSVRNGEVVAAKRDGSELKRQRVPRAWTVDGMFETVLADLEMNERAERGEPLSRFVKTLGIIEPEVGYLQRYLRVEMVEKGANPEAGWQVVSFTRATGDVVSNSAANERVSRP